MLTRLCRQPFRHDLRQVLHCSFPSQPPVLMPSSNMVRQKGQLETRSGAPVSCAIFTALHLILLPIFSSARIRPPPAPQQKLS